VARFYGSWCSLYQRKSPQLEQQSPRSRILTNTELTVIIIVFTRVESSTFNTTKLEKVSRRQRASLSLMQHLEIKDKSGQSRHYTAVVPYSPAVFLER